MRVITGTARGRKLLTLAGRAVRPTSAMVKEAVFSAIQFEVEGARVLDLFAGSGQMGIEALSRGARGCVLVDNARESVGIVRKNLEAVGLAAGARVVHADALDFLRGYQGEPFDIAFLDPPYGEDKLLAKALAELAPRMSGGCAVFCETSPEADLPASAGELKLQKTYKYGKTRVARYAAAHGPEKDKEGERLWQP